MSTEEIIEKAMELDLVERFEVIEALAGSLPGPAPHPQGLPPQDPDGPLCSEWEAEIERRLEASRKDPSRLVSREDLWQEIGQRRLARRGDR